VKVKADGGGQGDGVRVKVGVEDGGHGTDGFILARWVDFFFLAAAQGRLNDITAVVSFGMRTRRVPTF
jgi:hypothetical protein